MRFECKAEDLKKTAKSLSDLNKADGVLIVSWTMREEEEDVMLNVAYFGQYQIRFTLSNTYSNDPVIMPVKKITNIYKSVVSIPFDVFLELLSEVEDQSDLILEITDEKMDIYQLNNQGVNNAV
jgi:hypothetical protein